MGAVKATEVAEVEVRCRRGTNMKMQIRDLDEFVRAAREAGATDFSYIEVQHGSQANSDSLVVKIRRKLAPLTYEMMLHTRCMGSLHTHED